VPDRPRKSVGSETTFMEDLAPQDDVEQASPRCSTTSGPTASAPACRPHGDGEVKYADFQIVTRSRT
jgi:DNA polymerase-4